MTKNSLFSATVVLLATVAPVMAQTKGNTGDTFERHFLEMMSHHHQHGVEMAGLCQTKAQHAELK